MGAADSKKRKKNRVEGRNGGNRIGREKDSRPFFRNRTEHMTDCDYVNVQFYNLCLKKDSQGNFYDSIKLMPFL